MVSIKICNLQAKLTNASSMKRTDVIFLSTVVVWMVTTVCSGALANRTSEIQTHIPSDGDRLHPGISLDPRAITTVQTANRTVSICSDMFSPEYDADVSVYVDGDTLSYVQFSTKHIFRISSDTLSYIGNDNRSSEFRVDRSATPVAYVPGEGISTPVAWTGRLTLQAPASYRAR